MCLAYMRLFVKLHLRTPVLISQTCLNAAVVRKGVHSQVMEDAVKSRLDINQ